MLTKVSFTFFFVNSVFSRLQTCSTQHRKETDTTTTYEFHEEKDLQTDVHNEEHRRPWIVLVRGHHHVGITTQHSRSHFTTDKAQLLWTENRENAISWTVVYSGLIAVYSIMLPVPVFWPYKSAAAWLLEMFLLCTMGEAKRENSGQNQNDEQQPASVYNDSLIMT